MHGPIEDASSHPKLVEDIILNWEKALVSIIHDATRMLTKESAAATEREESDNIGVLSANVLREVFSQLDTPTQTGLRNVCFAWNSILESPVLTACIVVTGFEREWTWESTRHELQYFVTAPLFKCLRPSTQHILVDARDNWMKHDDFLMLAEVMHYVGRETGSRVRMIHFVGFRLHLQIGGHGGFEFDADNEDQDDDEEDEDNQGYSDKCPMHRDNAGKTNDFNYRLVDFIAACGDLPCDAVQLVDCALVLDFARLNEVELFVRLPAARLAVDGDVGSAVWAALEQCVPMPSNKQMGMLSKWLTSLTVEETKPLTLITAMRASFIRNEREVFCKALCATQSADPRPSLHYRGKQWCVDGVKDLQLEKLSAVALKLLVELMEHLKPSSVFYDDDSDDGSGGQPMDDESD
ncbi:uncharacterized protein LOC129602432 [Paramacrobiotus metropolitanus]|uniref:uncharacterized protein LOC129602432 n=1 Tax=Paramacrobiotus metropolitanus TaxID=2943436 RepID=UPI0024456D4D|nr:uncharacterized protein LOC129602432 [Paramacrobiotus metropolitanus]